MDIKQVLANIDSSVLTEESKAQISDVFEQVVNEKVESAIQDRIALEVEASLQEQDESHTSQLGKLLETIDMDHSKKLKKLMARVDEDHSTKLNDIVKHYESLLTEDAKALTESLEVDISNFLDLAIDELLPKNMLQEAVSNTKAAQKLQKIQELVSIDEAFIDKHVREALEDGKAQIELLRNNLNEVLRENVKLGIEKGKMGSDLIIERKTNSLPTEKKLFVEDTFKGKSASYIEENFDYALKMFERRENKAIESEKVELIKESVATSVDTPRVELNTDTSEDSYVNEYVSGLE